MAASNTRECVRELVGKHIRGVLFDALPIGRADLSEGNKTLVFFDGTGFTFAANGSFWQESADDVRRAIGITKGKLIAAKREVEDVLHLAGSTPSGGADAATGD